MHILKFASAGSNSELLDEAAEVLSRGGLVCFPCHGKYRIAADLFDERAVTSLFQSKRRVGKAPALVFVSSEAMLHSVVQEVDPISKRLMQSFWPGALTILFEANGELPKKVRKQILRGNGKVGVRIPDDPFSTALVERFGGPLLVSSANREKKAGDGSAAQVKKNFVHRVDLFIEAGDLRSESPSTVVDIDGEKVVITRPGAIPEDRILAV